MRTTLHRKQLLSATLCLLVAFVGTWQAAAAQWRLMKPTNTGVPGEAVLGARFAPNGDLWVSARWPFFQEGGVGIYDFAADIWTTYANWDSPVPSQYINDVEWAEDGSIWMASGAVTGPGGLIHKVGDTWTVYNAANSPLVHNIVSTIDLDADGHVWMIAFGTQEADSALYEFDGTNWREFAVPEIPFPAPWDGLNSLVVAQDGHVFVTNSVVNGLAEFDGETWTLHGGDLRRFRYMSEDANGNLWMASGDSGGSNFYMFDRTTGTFTQHNAFSTPMSSTTPTATFVDREGRVYLANWFGEVIRTSDNGETWSLFTNQGVRVTSITQQDNGDFWVTTPGAVRHLDANGTWLEAFNTYNTGLPDNWIEKMYRAPSGNMMFAAIGAGFSEFDGQRWFHLGTNQPNEPWPVLADGIESVLVDRAGGIWMGTNGVANYADGFLDIFDWQNTPAMGVFSGTAIGQDIHGDIWVGTEFSGGFLHFDHTSWEWVGVLTEIGADRHVREMANDSAGNMWVAAEGALHRWDGTTWTTWDSVQYPIIFDQHGIQSMAIAPDDTIWLGMGDGLLKFENGQFSNLYTEDNSPLPAKNVRGIAIRADGVIGLAVHPSQSVTPYPHGLVVIDGPIEDSASWTIHTYQNSPMRHYQLGDVEFDGDGNLWLSTISEGIAVLLIGDNGLQGDMNCDGLLSVSDIGPFVVALTEPTAYASQFPDCDIHNGDINDDGVVSVGDIGAFVELITK
ncbi:MAG: hypothetical protein AB7N71_09900 [Phycisphaerae bacterium]